MLLAAAVTAPSWARLLARGVPRAVADPNAADAPSGTAAQPAEAAKRINVKLYFGDAEQPALTPEDREVAYASDLGQQIRTVLEALIHGSAAGHVAPLPPDTRVLGVFVTARGVAYVDLSREATVGLAGSMDERLAIYALINSVAANFPAVRRVQILVDDRPVETLAGHIDLSRPLPPDMTLVAVQAPLLETPPDADPSQPAEPGPSPAPPSPRPGP